MEITWIKGKKPHVGEEFWQFGRKYKVVKIRGKKVTLG